MRWPVTQVYASDQTTRITDGNDLNGSNIITRIIDFTYYL